MASTTITLSIDRDTIIAECSDGSKAKEPFKLERHANRFFNKIRTSVNSKKSVEPDGLTGLGVELYLSCFRGKVGSKLDSLINHLEGNERIRIFLEIEPAHLHSYPWEFLYHPERGKFFNRDDKVTFARLVSLSRPFRALRVTLPLRILVIVCNPAHSSGRYKRFESNNALKAMKDALSPLSDNIEKKILFNPSIEETKEEITKSSYHVIHFLGHGDFINDKGILLFIDKKGVPGPVNADTVVDTFTASSEVRLICLSACHSGQQTFYEPFSSVAMKLMQTGIPAVIAMQFPVLVRDVKIFSQTFYKELTHGSSVDRAVQIARAAIAMNDSTTGQTRWDFGTPVLFMRTKEERFLELPEQPSEEEQTEKPEVASDDISPFTS